MNNEPVAIVKLGGDVEWLTDVLPYNAKLYTHPAKTLTDELKALLYSVNGDAYLGKEKEESLVAQVRKQYTEPAKTLTELSGVEIIGMSGKYDFNYEVDIIDFARAILKKASEK